MSFHKFNVNVKMSGIQKKGAERLIAEEFWISPAYFWDLFFPLPGHLTKGAKTFLSHSARDHVQNISKKTGQTLCRTRMDFSDNLSRHGCMYTVQVEGRSFRTNHIWVGQRWYCHVRLQSAQGYIMLLMVAGSEYQKVNKYWPFKLQADFERKIHHSQLSLPSPPSSSWSLTHSDLFGVY